jgi:predicted polyphosphate/ATP-dependent NAD kinase
LKAIGIIANPASGKDIRRLVSHATVIDNHEKINIVERIVLAAQSCGIEKVYIMPDSYQIGYKVYDNLVDSGELIIDIEILEMKITASYKDSFKAAEIMEEMGIQCIVALGGDGTNRAIAKGIKNCPLISLSTGTNNVYPEMIEGTVAGIAAGIIATFSKSDILKTCNRNKRIEIYREGELLDIALVDAVIARSLYVGSKAIWEFDDIIKIIATRANPFSIGFSTLIGACTILTDKDDFAYCLDLTKHDQKILAPIAAGMVQTFNAGFLEKIELESSYVYIAEENGIIALDGEREVQFSQRDKIEFRIMRNGPLRVDVIKTIELAQRNNFFINRNK